MTTNNNYISKTFGRKGDRVYKIILKNTKVVSFAWKPQTRFCKLKVLKLPIWSNELTSLFNYRILVSEPNANYVVLPLSVYR